MLERLQNFLSAIEQWRHRVLDEVEGLDAGQ